MGLLVGIPVGTLLMGILVGIPVGTPVGARPPQITLLKIRGLGQEGVEANPSAFIKVDRYEKSDK